LVISARIDWLTADGNLSALSDSSPAVAFILATFLPGIIKTGLRALSQSLHVNSKERIDD